LWYHLVRFREVNMARVTQAVEHLDIDELVVRIDSTKNAWHVRKLLVIWNATVDPRPAEEIAIHCGVARQTVHNWIAMYNRFGLDALLGPGKGGRRNQLMNPEEEREFLAPFFESARKGQIATVTEIKLAVEDYVGHPIGHYTIYRFLDRNEWRKVMPRPRHMGAKEEAQEEFKKNSPNR